MYPPGQFSPWNRASIRAAWLGVTGPGGGSAEPDAEPGYSALAVSDPSADATATQTWAAIDEGLLSDAGAPPRTGRDWGSHTGDTGPVRRRPADGPAGTGRAAPPSRGPGGDRRGAGAPQGEQAVTVPGSTSPRGTTPPGTRPPGTTPPGTSARGTTPPGAAAPEPVIPRATDRRVPAPATRQVSRGPGEAESGRRSRAAASDRTATAPRRAGKRGRRHTAMMAGLLLAPVLVVVLVAAGYVYFSGKTAPPAGHAAAGPRHTAAAQAKTSPTPTLGPWKHIESRTLDPAPLNVTELFPQQFSADGAAGVRTVDKASTNCPREVFGSALAAAVRKADCTQVLRASYLSTDHKLMATVGVLNLSDVTAAEHVGKVSGSAEFIKQLPAAHGPTRNLTKGTGIEEAEIKGHYLILIWTEFTDLKAPKGKSQRKSLEAFSAGLIAGTANVSLTKRMVNGQP